MAKRKKTDKNRPTKPVVAPMNLLRPMTPFERRMAELTVKVPPPAGDPDTDAHMKRLVDSMQGDLQFRAMVERNIERIPHWMMMRKMTGSGFLVAATLRDYYEEYLNRQLKVGFHGMPLSFNVVESFLVFDRELIAFDLREEREHLLSIDDYFDWYGANSVLRDPGVLVHSMQDGVNYSYNMTGDASGYRLKTDTSEIVIAGVSLIRHGNELSCMLVAGEMPPYFPDKDVEKDTSKPILTRPVKEYLEPNPDLTAADRYLGHLPGFARVILLARFDIVAKQYHVRYLNLDHGRGYTVFTDDYSNVLDSPKAVEELDERWRKPNDEALTRYAELFSALSASILLPTAFVDLAPHVAEVEVRTEFFDKQKEKPVKEALKVLGSRYSVYSRKIKALATAPKNNAAAKRQFNPPELECQADGFWKTLAPSQMGEDKDGHPVVGRTWVTRKEFWVAKGPQAFLLERQASAVDGPDPGVIYIVRSPAHGVELYKIGLTRKTAKARAGELTSETSAALPFTIICKWDVGDCGYVEKEAHRRLDQYRVNPRREFFSVSASKIFATIEAILAESKSTIASQQ